MCHSLRSRFNVNEPFWRMMLLQPQRYSQTIIPEYVLTVKKLQHLHGRNFVVYCYDFIMITSKFIPLIMSKTCKVKVLVVCVMSHDYTHFQMAPQLLPHSFLQHYSVFDPVISTSANKAINHLVPFYPLHAI